MITLIILYFFLKTIDARFECKNTTVISKIQPTVDFLFLLDASKSMCSKIDALHSGFKTFVQSFVASNFNARYGIVQFGGTSKISLPLQPNSNLFSTIVSGIKCSLPGQELV
jgi:hypothetical protein